VFCHSRYALRPVAPTACRTMRIIISRSVSPRSTASGARRRERREHERLLLPPAIAARLRFSDLIVPIPEIT
jgi:hypothetical protein